jgi:hypothetical protein
VDTLREVISSPSFIQAALLVALTGALSGFLVPWIKGRTDDKKARQQKIGKLRRRRSRRSCVGITTGTEGSRASPDLPVQAYFEGFT